MPSDSIKTPFLDEIARAKASVVDGRVVLWDDFFETRSEAEAAFAVLNDDTKIPWDWEPVVAMEQLEQHAYHYTRDVSVPPIDQQEGLSLLEDLCQRLSARFDCVVSDVFCNRFADATHHIDWHRDTYGTHIFVLSLGAVRRVQFRSANLLRRRRPVETLEPTSGDLYFMPLHVNKTHQHRVCTSASTAPDENHTRISLVFYATTPPYADAKGYKISRLDKVTGAFYSLVS